MSMSQGLEVAEDGGWRRGGRFRVAYVNHDPSMTKQEFAAECDINNIMARYMRDGVISHLARYQGRYEDVAGAVDFHTAQNTVLAAQDAFMSLPARLRSEFDNDPGAFLEFVSNPENAEKMIEMGLAKRRIENEVEQKVDGNVDTGEPVRSVARASKGSGAPRMDERERKGEEAN